MPKVPVANYRVEWNSVKNQGVVYVEMGGGGPKPVPIDSSEEFIAVMLMMSKSPVLFDTETKDFDVVLAL